MCPDVKWHVVDWMNNEMYDGKQFDSYYDARDCISQKADEYAEDMPKSGYKVTKEEAYDGYCEDMYAEIDAKSEEEARQIAIDWQIWSSEQDLSYGELSDWQGHFEQLAKRFNLTDEFKENGII